MKIKVKPEDFIVKERLKVSLSNNGPYQVWLLKKVGANTLDVIRDIAMRNRLAFSQIGYCGLKDRHSVSYQYISAPSGAINVVKGVNYELSHCGYMDRQLNKKDLLENQFDVVVRDVALPDELVLRELDSVNRFHLVNYYDEQRFGSARHGKGFVAKAIIEKNYRKALKLLIATPSKWDDKKTKAFKRCVAENWGKWERCIELAPTFWEKRVLEFLRVREFSNTTAKKALALVDKTIMELCFNAYQAYVWNLVAERIVLDTLSDESLIKIPYLYGMFHFYREIDEKTRSFFDTIEIPTISPKLKCEGYVGRVILDVIRDEGFESLPSLRSNVKGAIFRSHKRPFLVKPQVKFRKEWDEIYTGKSKWHFHFSLPPGSYATLVIKRVFYREL